MSGPATSSDPAGGAGAGDAGHAGVEITDGRQAQVGSLTVRRALPQRARRMVGAWCFADHMGPGEITADRGLDIGPHPHIGLQTVTWLIEGEVLHRDSLGSEQVIRPGQLNLMTAGHGVSHSEESTERYRGRLQGIQLWVALPDATRDGRPAFEHHAELPIAEVDGCTCTVLVGELDGVASPARRDTEHVGIDLDVAPGTHSVPLAPTFEHGLVVLDGALEVDGRVLAPGQLAHVGPGRDEIGLRATGRTRAVLLGGTPFPEQIVMWWNYVARDRAEIAGAHRSWQADDGRFGHVRSALERIDGGPVPWTGRTG